MDLKVNQGTYLYSDSENYQNLLVTAETSVQLSPDEERTIEVDTACMNLYRDIPGSNNSFDLKRLAPSDELYKLLDILNDGDYSYAVKQAAVWRATDYASYEDMGILQSGNSRVITQSDFDEAERIYQSVIEPDGGAESEEDKVFLLIDDYSDLDFLLNNEPIDGVNISDVEHLVFLRADFFGESESGLFTNLTNLEILYVSTSYINPNMFSELKMLSNLRELSINYSSQETLLDLTILSQLTQLESLTLYGNDIQDIAPLSAMTVLTELNLSGNNITDIQPLSGLSNLSFIDLSDNDITDYRPLMELDNLKEVYLEGNPGQDFSMFNDKDYIYDKAH
jgi:internalin A